MADTDEPGVGAREVPDGTVRIVYTDEYGRRWIKKVDRRDAEPGEEPKESPPLEESPPLVGLGEDLGGAWQQVEESPPLVGLGEDLGGAWQQVEESPPLEESTPLVGLGEDLGGAWQQVEESPPLVGLGEDLGGAWQQVEESPPLEESTPLFGPQEAPEPEPDYGPGDQPREGHWDPRSLQWVYDEPTMKSAGILDDTPWDKPREGNVDSTSFEGSTARGVDPSVPFDQADPNLQSGIPDPSGQAALGDYSSAPTLNPNLLDPTAPGATLDHGLVERIEQDPQLVAALNQNQELANALEKDPTRIYQIEQELGLAAEDQSPIEPGGGGGGATGLDSFTEPSLREEPGTAGQDAHDQDFEGI
jgi:hypothetical protein